MQLYNLTELIIVGLSSAGVIGTVISGILGCILRQTKAAAEKRRKERFSLELMRIESEEKLSQLILMLLKFSKGLCEMEELEDAEKNYYRQLEKTKEYKNGIFTEHITK